MSIDLLSEEEPHHKIIDDQNSNQRDKKLPVLFIQLANAYFEIFTSKELAQMQRREKVSDKGPGKGKMAIQQQHIV